MNKNAYLDRLLHDPSVTKHLFGTPLGPVLAAADALLLKACLFWSGPARPPGDSFSAGGAGLPRQIELAKDFFHAYFSCGGQEACDAALRGLAPDLSVYSVKEQQVFRQLMAVPRGATVTYEELSGRAGAPRGARFVGNCMAKNVYSVIIPCHRVVPRGGGAGNYSGGAEKKEYLLKMEGAII